MSTVSPGKAARGRLADGSPNPIDVHVGGRIRLRRTLLGISQEQLGEHLGLTFQQVQKYERGMNRIGAARLYQASRLLGVSVSYFFEDMPDEMRAASPAAVRDGSAPVSYDHGEIIDRHVIDFIRAVNAIPVTHREPVYALVRSLSAEG